MSELVKLGDYISIQKGKPPLLSSYYGNDAEIYLSPEYLRNNVDGSTAKAGSDAVRVSNGETVLLWDGSNAGEFFKAKTGLVASTMARISHSSKFRPPFFFHLLKHAERILRNQTNGTGIPHVDKEVLETIPVFCPRECEQDSIAQILDTLDTAIQKTEAIVEKLKQIKQGLMQDLLTRGVDANGELRPCYEQAPHLYKESPLGWIPKVWEIKYGSDVCTEIVVGIVIKPTQYYREHGIPVFRSANVRENRLSLENLVYMDLRDHRVLSKSAVKRGDVLTVRTGYPGTSCVVDDSVKEANCVDIIISRPSYCLFPEYWSTWINSDFGKKQVLAVQGGLAQQHFNVGDLAKLMVALPALDEQKNISKRLSALHDKIVYEDSYLQGLISIRFGLMDDLLTGRVRVTPLLAQS